MTHEQFKAIMAALDERNQGGGFRIWATMVDGDISGPVAVGYLEPNVIVLTQERGAAVPVYTTAEAILAVQEAYP